MRRDRAAGGVRRCRPAPRRAGHAHEYTFLTRTNLSGFADRHELPPLGRLGGEDGAPSRFLLRRAGAEEWSGVEDAAGNPSKFSNLIMEPGDSLRVENGGGGGFGPARRARSCRARDRIADGVATATPLAARPVATAAAVREQAPADQLAERARAIVEPHEETVCRATCPLQADPLRCPYHHAHALAFWPATSLATWTRRHCLLRDELEAELFTR